MKIDEMCVCVCDSLQPHGLMDCSPSGLSLDGILQARILLWAAMPSSGDLPDPGVEPAFLASPTLAGGFLSFVPFSFVIPIS